MLKPQHKWVLIPVIMIAGVALIKWTLFPGRAFDAMEWRAYAESWDGERQAMADRLLARGTLIGLTQEEVYNMLGVPPPTEYFRNWDFVYRLGPERGVFSVDSEWLVLRLGSDQRVVEAQIVRD